MQTETGIDIRRAGDRFHTRTDWLDSWHSFSFGPHHDPANTHHGLLLVSNDDIVAAGRGFGQHAHRDMEIVTWVLDGELEHRDSTGTHDVIYPGLAQRMSAGHGITHSEMNASRTRELHLVQMWVLPDTFDIEPDYEQVDVGPALAGGGLVTVASGRGDDSGGVKLHQRDASLLAARIPVGGRVAVPGSPFVHVFMARGSAELEGGGPVGTGDAARLTDTGELGLTAGPDGAEVLVWVMG